MRLVSWKLVVKFPSPVHVALNTVLPPKPSNPAEAPITVDAGTFTSNCTAVDTQLAPLPVWSFSGAYSVMVASSADGSFGTTSNGELIDRNTKYPPDASDMKLMSAVLASICAAV